MNIARTAYIASAAALATIAVPASAAIVTVDFGGFNTVRGNASFASYTEDGILFTAPTGQYLPSTTDGNGDTYSLLGGQSATGNISGTLTVMAVDGSNFNLAGFDLKSVGTGIASVSGYNGNTLVFTQVYVSPANSQYATYNSTLFSANIYNRVTINTSYGSNVNLDNFKFNLADVINPTPGVPEPATWGMMIAGFGMVGGTMRRRQRATVRFV